MIADLKHKYQLGDEVRVLGDTADWEHEFREGTVGKITDLEPSEQEWTHEPGYQVHSVDENGDSDFWNVAERDLELVYPPVTEQELREAYALLGVSHE